jgi:hypothetical protein
MDSASASAAVRAGADSPNLTAAAAIISSIDITLNIPRIVKTRHRMQPRRIDDKNAFVVNAKGISKKPPLGIIRPVGDGERPLTAVCAAQR